MVLGFIAFIYLGAQMTLYVAEANVVRARRLWPRSIVQPPLTEADERVLRDIAQQGLRRPEQQLRVRFDRDAAGAGPPADGGRPAPDDERAPTRAPGGLTEPGPRAPGATPAPSARRRGPPRDPTP